MDDKCFDPNDDDEPQQLIYSSYHAQKDFKNHVTFAHSTPKEVKTRSRERKPPKGFHYAVLHGAANNWVNQKIILPKPSPSSWGPIEVKVRKSTE